MDFASGYAVDRAISTALTVLRPGDVLVIEQQLYGPNSTAAVVAHSGQYGMVPVEWFKPYYDRIVTAVGLGIVVVEAAGNGGQNLDDAVYSTGNGGHSPFLPQHNSGAIMVGAGAASAGSSTESSRLAFSNYGSRVGCAGVGGKGPDHRLWRPLQRRGAGSVLHLHL